MPTLRQKKYASMVNVWYMRPFEARELSKIRYTEAPYLKQVLRDRYKLRMQFQIQADPEWSYTRFESEWLEWIKQTYIKNGWISPSQQYAVGRTRYQANVWKLLRSYRERAIDSGEYFPNPEKRKKKTIGGHITISKGNVQAQRARARERIKHLSGSDLLKWRAQRRAQKDRAKARDKLKRHPKG